MVPKDTDDVVEADKRYHYNIANFLIDHHHIFMSVFATFTDQIKICLKK